MLKQQLAKELRKPTKKLEKRKVHSDVTGNIRKNNCKKCAFLPNLRIISQEENMEIGQMTPSYFIYFSCSICL